jgi:2-oxoglutarate ferredoxin oxidoreductase subunit gamma
MEDSEVLFAGFGGQGMLLAGKVLAQAAMHEGMEVSWLPSYGPEMRGGTANVMVCFSSKPIGSPLISSPRALLVMNLPSLEKFSPNVKPGGLIVINESMIDRGADREDCTEVKVAARELATEAGTERAANFVMLCTYIGASQAMPAKTIEWAIEQEFTGRKAKFAPVNIDAFQAGLAIGQRAAVVRS